MVEGCVYAYWAARLGKHELSQRLNAEALKARRVLAERFRDDEGKPLDQSVLDKLTKRMRGWAESDANQGMPRPDLVKLWEIIARLPQEDMAKQAKVLVAGYKNLIDEDKIWKEPKLLALLTEQQKIDYWLYKLRDLDDTVYGDMFAMSMGRRTSRHILSGFLLPPPVAQKPNPALELKKIGVAALPAVIAHLDDTRPTRCGPLLRYGDCCQQIFEGITAHKIFDDHGTENYPVRAGEEKLCKVKAENWWAEYRAKGEKPILLSAVAEGTLESWAQVDQLLQKYPNDAFESIVKGVRQSRDENVRVGLITAACKVKETRLPTFLQEELHGPFLRLRVTAARGLIEGDNRNGCLALINEWHHMKWGVNWLGQDTSGADELIEALLRSGDKTAVEDVARSFPKQPIWIRCLIVQKSAPWEGLKDFRGQSLNQAIRIVIEDMLAGALDDTEIVTSSRGILGGKEVAYPTVGELAADGLNVFWGQHLLIPAFDWQQPMMFNLYGRPGDRERQRLQVKNAWLKKRGRPLLPVPTPLKITPTDPTIVDPLLERVVAAKSREKLDVAIASLEKLGLPALPAILKASAKLPDQHPARAALESAASRLALTITQIRFSSDSAAPPEDLQKHLAALQAKPISSDEMNELFQFLTSHSPRNIDGVHLKLERPGDNSGACLTITLVPAKAGPGGAASHLDVLRLVLLDNKRITGGGSEGTSIDGDQAPLTQADWKEFVADLRQVYPPRPEQYLFVQMGCCKEYR